MSNFADIFNEVGKLLEETKAVLTEMANEDDAEPEKKGVSWDELANWIAESENVGEFEMDTDAGDLTFIKKDDDGPCDCEYCTEPEEFNYEDDDFNYDDYDEDDDFNYDDYDESDESDECDEYRAQMESEPAPKGISLIGYREALFRHIEKKNPEVQEVERLKLTNALSNVIWEILTSPNTATQEEIATAHNVFLGSKYLLASIEYQIMPPGLDINFSDVEAEIENYLEEKK